MREYKPERRVQQSSLDERENDGEGRDSLSTTSEMYSARTSERLLQLRMQVGRVDDPAEIEAEQFADAFIASWQTGEVTYHEDEAQRSPEDGSDSQSLRTGGFAVGGDFESALAGSGTGSALPSALQSQMGAFLGADLAKVRVHTDAKAAELSRSIGAEAFTTGSNIYFGQGAYDPSSRRGQHLIAHEVTHTLQQGAVRRNGISRRVPTNVVRRDPAAAATQTTPTTPKTKEELQTELEAAKSKRDNAVSTRDATSQSKDQETDSKRLLQDKLNLLKDLEKAFAELTEAEQKLRVSNERMRDLTQNVDVLQTEVNGIEAEIARVSSSIISKEKTEKQLGIDQKVKDNDLKAAEEIEAQKAKLFNRAKNFFGLTAGLNEKIQAIQQKNELDNKEGKKFLADLEALKAKSSDLQENKTGKSAELASKQTERDAERAVNELATGKKQVALGNVNDAKSIAGSGANSNEELQGEIDRKNIELGEIQARIVTLTDAFDRDERLVTDAQRELDAAQAAMNVRLIEDLKADALKERELQDLKTSAEVFETFSEGVASGAGQADELSKAKWAPVSEEAGANLATTEIVAKGVIVFTQAGDAIASLKSWDAVGTGEVAQKSTKAIITGADLVTKIVFYGKELSTSLGSTPGVEMVPIVSAVGALFSIFEEWSQTTWPLWKTWGELNTKIDKKQVALQGLTSATPQDPAAIKKMQVDLGALKTVRGRTATNYSVSFGKVASDLAVAVGSFMSLGGAFIPGAALAAIGGFAKITIGLGSYIAGWVRTAKYAEEASQFDNASATAADKAPGDSEMTEYAELYQKVVKYHSEVAFKDVVVKALMEDDTALLHSLGLDDQWIGRQKGKLDALTDEQILLKEGEVHPRILQELDWSEGRELAVKFIGGGDIKSAYERVNDIGAALKRAANGIAAAWRGTRNVIASFFGRRSKSELAPNRVVATASLQMILEQLSDESLRPYIKRKEVAPWFFGLAGASHGVKDEKVLKFAEKHLKTWFMAVGNMTLTSEMAAAASQEWKQIIEASLLEALRFAPLRDKGSGSQIKSVDVEYTTANGFITGISSIKTSGDVSGSGTNPQVSRSPISRGNSVDLDPDGNDSVKPQGPSSPVKQPIKRGIVATK